MNRPPPVRAGAAILALAWAMTLVSCHAPRTSSGPRAADGKIVATVDSTFARDVLGTPDPAVVYFSAFGCIPCVRIAPHVERLAARYAGRVTFWELDRGWSAERVRRYGVPAVPTMIFFAHHEEVSRLIGMPTPSTDDSLAAFVEAGLRSAARAAATAATHPGP